ncbi:alpha-2-macroglobulin family protein [Niastella vici]|nr:MG2 domain-containing protein [Niastella vici]
MISMIFPLFAFSQNDHDPVLWESLETAIRQKNNLVDIYQQLGDIETGAQKNGDPVIYARARYYQLLITDVRTEDTFYFRNSSFIDSTLQNLHTPASLRLIMHIMQAHRLQKFYQKAQYRRPLYETRDLPFNYAAFSNAMLDSTIQYHYEQAKSLSPALNSDNPENFAWLSSNPMVFLFKPAMFDIIIAEQIAYNTNRYWFNDSWQKQFSGWLKLSPAELVKALDTVQSNSREVVALHLYKEWLGKHQQDSATFFFIESLVRKYIYEKAGYGLLKESEYEKYLLAGTESPIPEVRAHAVYQLCLLWHNRTRNNEYIFSKDKFPPAKALELYESNKALFNDFAFLGRELEGMKKQILASEITWKMNDCVLPNEPILTKIEYKNVSNLYYRVIQLGHDEQLPKSQDTAILYLLNKSALRSVHESLPVTSDLDKHKTFLKIDRLTAGRYAILFAPNEITGFNKEIAHVTFQVTQIAIVASDNRVYVLNRKTGLPLTGVSVSVSDEDEKVSIRNISKQYGYVLLKKTEDYEVEVANGSDSLYKYIRVSNEKQNDHIYNKEEDDDLLDYYIDNAQIKMLTDRSIYRPGQTVYYKGIVTTRDPYTGATIIANKKNLQHGLFRNFLKKWLNEDEPEMYITDPFKRKVDTFAVKPNAYGSIAGSFHIPATAATGTWEFDGDIDNVSWRDGAFRVEEYKRPTFELTAEPPATTYLPGDAITFKLKVRSFAGSTMAHTKIQYSISRSVPYYLPEGILEEMQFDSSVTTGENGIAEIVVTDTALQKAKLPDSVKYDFHYQLTATATDLSGESHEIDGALHVSTQPVVISFPLKHNYYIHDQQPVLITTKDPNKIELARNIQVKIYREKNNRVNMFPGITNYADQWKYSKEQLAQWFPDIEFSADTKPEKELVYETTINTGAGEKLRIPFETLKAGEYTVQATCYENNIVRGNTKGAFTIFDTASTHLPVAKHSFFNLPFNSVNPGDNVQVYAGSAYDSTYLLLQIKYFSLQHKKQVIVPVYREQIIKAGVHAFTFHIPNDVTDHAIITSFFIRNNEACRHSEKIWINQQSAQPAIIIEQFRSKLTPGQQTTFSVSVKTRDDNVAAEMASTCYDASLDKLEKHKWEIPQPEMPGVLRNEWPERLIYEATGRIFLNRYNIPEQTIKHPVWWMRNTLQKPTDRFGQLEDEDVDYDRVFTKLEGRMPGIAIEDRGLNDVIVVGYGTSKKPLSATANVITIRGSNSINGDWNDLLVLIDGVPYTGKLNELNTAEITDMMMLKGADATAIYGARGAKGVILISTKGPVKLPEIKQEPIVKIRSNFNELAFFYPAVHAGKDGYYRFTFTVPESLTEWNWKLFAHTKKAQFAYAERKLNTQLPFMVIPNIPKLLYQGDHLILKSRISNLDSLRQTGKTICKVEDAVTGEDITAIVVKAPENRFEVGGHSNTVTGTVLTIPKGQLNPVKIIVKALAGDFADGEEHIIPILTDKILVKHVVPFSFVNNRDTLISLPAKNDVYGVGLSIQPKPQAALINSLPFLANYSFDCAEQTFNKMLANIIALNIMQTDKVTRQVYITAKQTTEKYGAPALLPDQLNEQAMPWLQLTSRTTLQQKQLYELLDTVRTKAAIDSYLNKLYKLQNKDGGLCWFEGGKSSSYISAYVLAGFGKLAEQADRSAIIKGEKMDAFIGQLVHYTDGDLNDLFTLYARGYWRAKYPVTATQYMQIENNIKQQWEQIDNASLYKQALLIITAMKWFNSNNTLYEKALQQLEHIRQQAIEDPVKGIRWKFLANADYMTVSWEEALALLAEAFGKTTGSANISEGIIKWILTSKSGHEWKSTKAAAAAISLLQKTQQTVIGAPNTINSTINNQLVTVTDDLLSGQPVSFIKTNNIPQSLKVGKTNDALVQGNILTWQFMAASTVNQLIGVQLIKHIFRLNNVSNKWEPVSDSTVLKVSDNLKVVIEIETAGYLPYVYIDDKTSGAFEPVDANSGYEFGNNFQYYRSVRDAGMQFFAEHIPAGRTDISYELRVAQEGTFTFGPASLQCMYNPEKAAYSNSTVIKTQP